MRARVVLACLVFSAGCGDDDDPPNRPVPDTTVPTWPGGSLTASDVTDIQAQLSWSAAQDSSGIASYEVFRDGTLAMTVGGDETGALLTGLSPATTYVVQVQATDTRGNQTTDGPTATFDTETVVIPPDPVDIAPTIGGSSATNFDDAIRFLVEGADAVQRGVEPDALTAERTVVLKGTVRDESGAALPAVRITALDHPELGFTLSRADGVFDFVANGGGRVVLRFAKAGFPPVQREVRAPWQDFVWVEEVRMVRLDDAVTTVTLGTAGLARANSSTDGDGARQATMLVPAALSAEVELADGSRQSLDALSLRATEFTVGADGPARMPGRLPASSGYTYAVDLSADEAADTVALRFDQPLYFYVDNFLGFPVGSPVPVGYFDEARGVWVPADSGRIIEVVAVSAGEASVDVDGDGSADSGTALTDLGITAEELGQLGQTYSAGTSLWRVGIEHFSPWDCNWGFAPPADAEAPSYLPEPYDPDPCNQQEGSVIYCQQQALGETIPLVGVPFSLHYSSSRSRAANRSLTVTLRGPDAPASLTGVLVDIQVAGQRTELAYDADPDPSSDWDSYEFLWDGRDTYGRPVQGAQPVVAKIGYLYDGAYGETDRFGGVPGVEITGSQTREEIALWTTWHGYLGGIDHRAANLGGWSLSIHHAYDPRTGDLYLGTGDIVRATASRDVVTTVAGTGEMSSDFMNWTEDGLAATEVALGLNYVIDGGPDGSVYIADGMRGVLRVDPAGIITRVAGGGTDDETDGLPALGARVTPISLAVGGDGSIYVATDDRVRRINPDGFIFTIAGGGSDNLLETGGPALEARFTPSRVAVADDGNVYISDADECVVWRLAADGMLVRHAGVYDSCDQASSGDGGLATAAVVGGISGLAVAPDGTLHIADPMAFAVRRVSVDGTIEAVAGSGDFEITGDGGPAIDAGLGIVTAIAFAPDGTLYVAAWDRLRRVDQAGVINTVAGGGTGGVVDGSPALATEFSQIYAMAVSPSGRVTILDFAQYQLRRLSYAVAGTADELHVPAADGGEVFVFDNSGRHLRTVDPWTGAVLWSFHYDDDGRLTAVVNVDVEVTTISRAADGTPLAIAPPQAAATTVTVDGDGFLASVVNPAGHTWALDHDADGLLMSFIDPNLDEHAFTYDAAGRLVRDDDPEGGFKTLSRERLTDARGFAVTVTTASSRTTGYRVEWTPADERRLTTTFPSGLTGEVEFSVNGDSWSQGTAGAQSTWVATPDPLFGMQAPLYAWTQTTPAGHSHTIALTRDVQLGTITEELTEQSWVTTHTFNETTRTSTVVSPEGRTWVGTRDTNGRLVTIQWGTLTPVTVAYDAHGQPTGLASGAGARERVVTVAWDAVGTIDSVTDGESRVLYTDWDAAHRLTTLTLTDGRQIGFGYDNVGNVTSVTPPGRGAYVHTFDGLGQLDGVTPPQVGASTDPIGLSYNLDRQLTTITRPDGTTVDYGYDTAGRLSTVDFAGDGHTRTYDATYGWPATVVADSGITTTTTYDGPLLTSEAWSGTFSGAVSVEHTWLDGFRLDATTVNGGDSVSYDFDQDGLLTGAGALSLVRGANGDVESTSAGGITTTHTYNEFGEPTGIAAQYSSTVFYQVTASRDRIGRIVTAAERVEATSHDYVYTYDTGGRLTEVTQDAATIATYVWDTNSNCTSYGDGSISVAATYDEQDRMVSHGTATYSFTRAGELDSRTDSGTTSYTYDALGGLRSVVLPDARVITYELDGAGRRVVKRIDGVFAGGWVYEDQLRPAAAVDEAGVVTQRYVYGDRVNVPELILSGGETWRVLTDLRGSVRLVVNVSTGVIVQQIDYDPFGHVTADSAPGTQPFGFAGGLYDPDTGLVRFGARDYDPSVGRWTARDPIGFAGGDWNLYGYVQSDPINGVDPWGLAGMFANSQQMGRDGPISIPDVCFTPPENPATPPGVPIPYPNIPAGPMSTKGNKGVKVKTAPISGTKMTTTSGNQAGSSINIQFFGNPVTMLPGGGG